MSDPATPEREPAPATGPPASPEEARPSAGLVLRGTPVAPGLVLGPVRRKDYDLSRQASARVPLEQIELELNRFRKSLDESRRQLRDLKARLENKVRADDARILDTHLLYLKDSVFIADVENLILNEQMALEAAIARVIGDFDRIFRLVESDTLRQSAVDLRDVGIRVLRNLESAAEEAGREEPERARQYVLVARQLSIVDMFNLENECVLGIAAEEGGLSSHAAIFARSMRIPTLTGVEGLLDKVHEGDFVILDAAEGLLRVNPDDVVRAQYQKAELEAETAPEGELPDWARGPALTHDGEELSVSAACGNLPEVEQALSQGLTGVGIYRTELLYLVEKDPPSRESLVRHYRSVVEGARGGSVCFRLLNADSGLQIAYLHDQREPNPALGRLGARLLFSRELLLRRQLQAILLAGAGARLSIALPFVTDCADLRRLKEILFDERLELRKGNEPFQERVELAAVLETPASLLGVRDLARESDHLYLNLDSLLQYLLAADRENPDTAELIENLHPFALRAVTKVARTCQELHRPLSVFGVAASLPANLAVLVGAGLRSFCIPPGSYRAWRAELRGIDARVAARNARAASRSSCAEEVDSLVSGYRHGLGR